MRGFIVKLAVIIALAMLLLPLFALPREQDEEKKKETESKKETAIPTSAAPSPSEYDAFSDIVRVYIAEEEEVREMVMNDYIYGVVAAECPLLYHEEALKAQIVAAHTYTRYLMVKNKESDYDVTTDHTLCQAYIDREKALENWGENSEKYDKKLKNLLNEALSKVVTYKGEPIFAAYHAISSGQTENAENVWGNEVAYLKSVESVGDKLAKGYLSEVSLTFEEADSKLLALGITAKELSAAKLKKSAGGCVISATSGEKEVSGGEISKALGLRSANFDVSATENGLKFSVRGYGHQVGMSQNGANYMAKSGSNHEEILKHYYSGVEITLLN